MLWRRTLLLVLVVHLALVLARVPHGTIAKRARQVRHHQAVGRARFFLDTTQLHGADAVARILREVPEDGVVLWRGVPKGAFEFAAALLYPRLCVAIDAVTADAQQFAERPIAPGMVLVSHGERVDVEPR